MEREIFCSRIQINAFQWFLSIAFKNKCKFDVCSSVTNTSAL